MSSTAQPLAPNNPAPANEPSASELAAQVQALTKLVESNLLHSKTATVGSKKKRGTIYHYIAGYRKGSDPCPSMTESTYGRYGYGPIRESLGGFAATGRIQDGLARTRSTRTRPSTVDQR
ncbi:hypothetical protein B0H19DRAFT_1067447 [Mycena capillaripes]|nr:hypothetical protein B0H19DRAFT_1067447 [Mycena capillaripes]